MAMVDNSRQQRFKVLRASHFAFHAHFSASTEGLQLKFQIYVNLEVIRMELVCHLQKYHVIVSGGAPNRNTVPSFHSKTGCYAETVVDR